MSWGSRIVIPVRSVLGAATVAATLGCSSAPPAPTPPTGPACGVERWPVKTLTDAAAIRVDLSTVIRTTIAELNRHTPRCSDLPDDRTFAEEFRVYEVVGLVQLTHDEGDRDVHVVLADPADPARTIVAEVVDPACAAASPMLTTFSNARVEYRNLGSAVGRQLRVRGVGFYDFAHGQTGRSESCLELHPVLNISPP
jgi:hypothetical protein